MGEDAGGPHACDLFTWEGRPTAPALLRLRARARERYPLREVPVPLALVRCPLKVTLPADPDAPLDAIAARLKTLNAASNGTTAVEADLTPAFGHPSHTGRRDTGPHRAARSAIHALATGAHLPYWALLWPSGQALAEALVAHLEHVAGRRVLELGCGLGVTAATALALGADVWAADCFPDALLFAAINCLRNAGRRPRSLLLDWRTEAGRAACRALAPFDLVLAADVLYEAEDEAPLLDLIPSLLREGGAFWLAEPGRRVSREFVARALAAGWRDEAVEVAHPWPLEREEVRVGIHRFTLPGREGVH